MDPTSLLAKWKGWASAPFQGNVSLLDFVLLTIISATIALLWTRILEAHLKVDEILP